MKELTDFIESNPEERELKRALAVQMVKQNLSYARVAEILRVFISFVGKWKQIFEQKGISGLTLKYQGSKGYLEATQKQAVVEWLQQKQYWNLQQLKMEIEDKTRLYLRLNRATTSFSRSQELVGRRLRNIIPNLTEH